MYGGKRLENGKRLADYNVKRDATIQVNIKLSGGMDQSRALRSDPDPPQDNDVDMTDAHGFANNEPMDVNFEWPVPQQFPEEAQPQAPPPAHANAHQMALDGWETSVCTIYCTGMHEASRHEG
jgi:hypothetical protein